MTTNSFQYSKPGNTSALDMSRFGIKPGAVYAHCHNGSVECSTVPESGEIEVPGACSEYNTEHLNRPFYCPDENVKCGCPGGEAGCAECGELTEQVNESLLAAL